MSDLRTAGGFWKEPLGLPPATLLRHKISEPHRVKKINKKIFICKCFIFFFGNPSFSFSRAQKEIKFLKGQYKRRRISSYILRRIIK